ncbi:signal peptide containing protein [Theileria equi strain WA]|uniref:Signal peptide containing protein n=1 Tax=Theileria equi strain WA TaxID=1537102 RepID=L1LB11_THEEQ|nr:signal peptide containing protein [Theileria equi strain WA]EKX72328.1 signal peptide containing protein [Theileria equi strain WA]|eukprot:XP_004831780.1 signal peptide containing protein [Theileria equi strain WA]
MKLVILATLLGLCMATPSPASPSKKKEETPGKSPAKKTPTDKELPESYNDWLGILPHEFISLEKRRSEALRKWQTTQMGKNPFLDPYYEELMRKEARTKLEGEIKKVKEKPIENKKEYDASKDGKFDEWLAKSKAVEMGARKLYEEAKAKVDAITETESKEKFEERLKKILKKVEEITKEIKELEKIEEKESSKAIEKALGHFLGHFQTRAMIKSDVSELILDIAREQGDGDQVLKILEQFLVALERSPLA